MTISHVSYKMASFERLEGTKEEKETGGLVIPKKRAGGRGCDEDEGVFKKPKVSLLGLDALAREKRKQSAVTSKKAKESSSRDERKRYDFRSDEDGGSVRVSFGSSRPGRHYRSVIMVIIQWLIVGYLV